MGPFPPAKQGGGKAHSSQVSKGAESSLVPEYSMGTWTCLLTAPSAEVVTEPGLGTTAEKHPRCVGQPTPKTVPKPKPTSGAGDG